jgi:GAF domain-containing protein
MSDHLLAALTKFSLALAQKNGHPRAAFSALHALADAVVGANLFTVLLLDYEQGVMRRLYSSDKVIYPEGGADPIGDTLWERTIIGEQKPLVMEDYQALRQLLPEHETLRALGLGAMLNLPIVVGGKTIGTLNMLHEDGRYTPERVAAAEALKPAAVTMLLLAQMKFGPEAVRI